MTREPLTPPPWAAEEVQRLRELAATGAPTRIITLKLRRSVIAVRTKAGHEGIALGKSKDEWPVEPMTRKSLRALWTAEELQQLRELAAAGAPTKAIAVKLRRSESAVRHRAKSEGIALARRKSE